MNSFYQGLIETQAINQQLLQTIRLIGEYKGKQELFKRQAPQVIKNLPQAVIIQSIETSNRIEGTIVPLERIKKLVSGKETPGDRSDREIVCYRDVLTAIHDSYPHIPFTPNLVLELHRALDREAIDTGGKWKTADNEVDATNPDGTPAAMESLHDRFNYLWESGKIEKLLLIPTYILDFLCLRPFSDGNERMARLLTLLLLYKGDYEIGQFISLDSIVEKTKEDRDRALDLSSQNWREGKHELLPWWQYFLGVMLLSAYQELEEKVEYVTPTKGTKTAIVLEGITSLPEEFSVKQLQEKCPQVSRDLIRHVLRQQRNAGHLECLGRGVKASWRKR